MDGRVALEPALLLGVSILQDLDGVPDRQAVELLHDHAGWNFALNRQLGDPVFHPTSLVNFRQRLLEHEQSALGFTTILDALVGMEARPAFWVGLWERYVDSQADDRASAETTGRKLGEAGAEAWQSLEWVRGAEGGAWAQGAQVQLLARVFREQFAVVRGQVTSLPQEKVAVPVEAPPPRSEAPGAGAQTGAPESPE